MGIWRRLASRLSRLSGEAVGSRYTSSYRLKNHGSSQSYSSPIAGIPASNPRRKLSVCGLVLEYICNHFTAPAVKSALAK
uniref:Uncharacterized protein n=1 Tax=Arundo donax TaxID=35708 RepID=A0A0A9HVB8_ARUDO